MANPLRLEYINLLPWRRVKGDEELGLDDDYSESGSNTRSAYTPGGSTTYSINEGDLDLLGFIEEENASLLGNANGEKLPEANHRLRLAVEMQDISSVETWLQNGADPNFSFGPNHVKCLHLATSLGNLEIVRRLAEAGADVRATDARGVTPLHVAASREGRTNLIRELVRLGADVNTKDSPRDNGGGQETPLHRAAFRGQVESVRKLISLGAQVYAVEGRGRTPLHLAAQRGAVDCIQVLLDHGADPNALDKKGASALLLLGGSFLMRGNKKANSYSESVEVLIKGGARVNVKDPTTEITPLHQAVTLGRSEATKLLLSAGAYLNAQDREGNTAIHACCLRGHASILKLLLAHPDAKNGINLSDSRGRSPLHKAAYRGSTECIQLLLRSGADLGEKTKSGVSAVTLILQLPNGAKILSHQFDESISTNGIDPSEYTCRLKFDYSILMSRHKNQQMSVIEDILDDHRERRTADLLQHPLIASFLYLKWRKIRYLFFSTVITYLTLVSGVTAYVWTALSREHNQPKSETSNQVNQTLNHSSLSNTTNSVNTDSYSTAFQFFSNPNDPPHVIRLQLFLVIIIIIIIFQEVIQFVSLHTQYFKEAESYIKWGALVTSSIVIFTVTPWEEWVRHVSAFAILLGWTEVTLLLGRLPTFGVYALMFYSVAQHLAKFVFVFFFFLAGFSFSFHIIFTETQPAFANPWTALLRTLSMMIGDLSYDDYLTEGKFSLPGTAHVIYFLFLILVALILMNLLIGLAVNDIQGLQKEGRVKRLRKQAQYIVYLEDVVNHRILRWVLCKSIVRSMNNWINHEPVFATNPAARKQNVALPASTIEHALSIAHDGKKPVDTLTLSDAYNLVQECVSSIELLRQRVEGLEQVLMGPNNQLGGSIDSNSAETLHANGDSENENRILLERAISVHDSDLKKSNLDVTSDDDHDEVDHRSHRTNRKLTIKKSRAKSMKRSLHTDMQEIKSLLLEIKGLKYPSSSV